MKKHTRQPKLTVRREDHAPLQIGIRPDTEEARTFVHDMLSWTFVSGEGDGVWLVTMAQPWPTGVGFECTFTVPQLQRLPTGGHHPDDDLEIEVTLEWP